MAMAIPPTLKPVTQFVRRAEKLDSAPEPEAPVVAYYCRLYAVEQAMKLQDTSEEGNKFLMAMITRLEGDKKKGMDQFTKEEGQKITMDWAMKEFDTADEEDRAGLADQNTARTFYAAGVFFDVVRQFGEPDEEMTRRRMYCKWKASEILKALKAGRTPTPGGAGEDVPTGMPPATTTTTGGGDGGVGDYGQMGTVQPTMPAEPDLPASAEPKGIDPLAGIIPEAPEGRPSAPAVDSGMGGGGGVPATPYDASPAPYDPPSTATPYLPTTTYGDPSGGGGGGGGMVPPQGPVYPAGPMGDPSSQPWNPNPGPAPAATPASAPAPAMPVHSPAPARPRTPVPSSSGSRRKGGGSRPLEGNIADAIEHCQFAIRALEHKNVDTAVQRLQDALQQIT